MSKNTHLQWQLAELIDSSRDKKIDVTWELLLAPVPTVIAIISQLLVNASHTIDFEINVNNPGPLISHPESFRTTVVQIANEAYKVFNQAHSNMDRILIKMSQVPGHVKEVYQILNSNNQPAIEKMLPRRLNRITEAAVDGEKLSKDVSDGFNYLIELIQQVLEANLTNIGSNKRQIEAKIKAAIEEERQRQMSIKKKEKQKLEKKRQVGEEILKFVHMREERTNPLDLFGYSPMKLASFCIINHVRSCAGQRLEETITEAAKVKEDMKTIDERYAEKLKNVHVDVVKDNNRDKAIELLVEGLGFLTNLKESWDGMACFFERVKIAINKATINPLGLPNYVKTIQGASSIDLMSNAILNAEETSCLTQRIADMYVKVSDRYIICNLDKMQNMNVLKDEELREAHDQLISSCQKASHSILDMIVQDPYFKV